MTKKSKKAAFTLAEVLITLGIIGVVAAMTLPSLIQERTNKALYVALWKNYSVMQQAIMRMTIDKGELAKAGDYDTWTFKDYFREYFNVVQYYGTVGGTGMGGDDENGEWDMYKIESYRTYNFKSTLSTNRLDDGQFLVTDGTFYLLENSGSTKHQIYISVDVNGLRKGPNAWGHDLFTFQLTTGGKVIPMGAEGTDYDDLDTYCSPSSTDKENGIGCTYRALYDKNYWKELP